MQFKSFPVNNRLIRNWSSHTCDPFIDEWHMFCGLMLAYNKDLYIARCLDVKITLKIFSDSEFNSPSVNIFLELGFQAWKSKCDYSLLVKNYFFDYLKTIPSSIVKPPSQSGSQKPNQSENHDSSYVKLLCGFGYEICFRIIVCLNLVVCSLLPLGVAKIFVVKSLNIITVDQHA